MMQYWWQGDFHNGPIGLSVTGPAFRFGFGFFETVLWDGGQAVHLARHMERIHASLEAFGLFFGHAELETVIPELCTRNGLADVLGRVNIIYAVDEPRTSLIPVVTAVPYTPPEDGKALEFAVSERPFQSWLGAHKSANHLVYYLEHQTALGVGKDGAVLQSPCGHVLEAAHASLLFSDGTRFVTPDLPDAGILPGIALELMRERCGVQAQPVPVAELGRFQHAYACNSLMGVRAVSCIGDVQFAVDHEAAFKASQSVLSEK